MIFKALTIIEDDTGFNVLGDDTHIAAHLGRDETLGCIASALFTDHMPLYMQTLAAHAAWQDRYGGK